MRRVVITGLGMVSPLACGVKPTWERLVSGCSGINLITNFKVSDIACRIAGQVPAGEGDHDFNADDWVKPKDQRKIDRFILYAIAAACQAVEDAGWTPDEAIANGALLVEARGPRRLSPFFIPSALINLASGHVSIRYGFKGPNHSVVTACSTGAHAIGDASRLIQHGDADVMIAGGAESAVCRLGMAGFAASRALSTHFNDSPTRASRPWDVMRDGFVMGEGSGVLVVEELQHARARGARIYAEVVGYGMSGDAHHITAPATDGNGGFRSMRAALRDAGLNPENIDYINAHGTSTPLGDEIELGAVKRLFGSAVDKVAMSSTKSSIGHLLGAAGSVEAIFSILAINHGVVPPTLNLDNPSPGCDINLVPHQAQERPVRNVLSNSFGFGGTNASLVFSQAP